VDRVLIGNKRAECVTAPALKALFKTEDGDKGCGSDDCTSFSGLAIVLSLTCFKSECNKFAHHESTLFRISSFLFPI